MPLIEEEIDGLSGLLFPFYDADTHMLYLAGKVRWFASGYKATRGTKVETDLSPPKWHFDRLPKASKQRGPSLASAFAFKHWGRGADQAFVSADLESLLWIWPSIFP